MRGGRLLILSCLALCAAMGFAQKKERETQRHVSGLASAPAREHSRANPYEGNRDAVRAGRKLFERYCADCHGADLRGRGKAPALDSDLIERTPPGDLFWFLTNGDLRAGMPAWSRLPDAQRWQVVTYLKTLRASQTR